MVSRLDDQPLGPEVPPYTVESAYFRSPIEEGHRKRIKIIDFGEASFLMEERKTLRTPMILQAPEAFFGESVGGPADIWAFACTVFDIFGKRSLFETFMPDKDSVLLEMVSALGMPPKRWWEKWENRSRYFLSDGAPNTNSVAKYHENAKPLALLVQQMRLNHEGQLEEGVEQLSAENLATLQELLASTLRYEPSERATVEEIVKLDWVQQLLRDLGIR